MKIALGADHGGYALKEAVKAMLESGGYVAEDIGTDSPDAVDYPAYVAPVVRMVLSGEVFRGILICGSGIGMSIAANRFPGIRAALCLDAETARLSRAHNDSNVLVLAGRKTDAETARSILDAWLSTDFEAGRHLKRIQMIETVMVS